MVGRSVCYGLAVTVVVVARFVLGCSWTSSVALGYLSTLLDQASTHIGDQGDRTWHALQRWNGWKTFASFLWGDSSILISPEDLKEVQNTKQAIVAAHPHGVMSFNHALFLTDLAGYGTRFPLLFGEHRRDLAASVTFTIPLFRDGLLWLGHVDAAAHTAKQVLRTGRSMFVYPGGEKEQMLTREHEHRCWVNTRKGFCRLAVEFGIPVIPHYVFGETDLYSISQLFSAGRFWVCDKLHVALPLAFGRGGLPWPFALPHNPPQGLSLCIGSPVQPTRQIDPRKERPEFDTEVDALHARYLVALRAVFDANKVKCGYPDAKLELLPPLPAE